MRLISLTLTVVALLSQVRSETGAPGPAADVKHRGVSWVAGREIDPNVFRPLVEGHVNWIVQTPFGWQRGLDAPEIGLATQGGVLWGETDEGLRVTARLARRFGINTLLKPHLWVGRAWRGEIRMATEEEWDRWFESYRQFILHYARFAEAEGIAALCVGTELRSAVNERPEAWRRMIAEIRSVYHGKLTYAANWFAEYEEVSFWDVLDFIGIQAYFPLSDKPDPSLEDLAAGWKTHLERIEAVQARYGKPVLFTEIGYRSVSAAASRPWEWPKRNEAVESDPDLQARCYQAFFETVWSKPWCAGAYWWKWFPHARVGRNRATGFTPQDKPAQRVLFEWYGRNDERAGTP